MSELKLGMIGGGQGAFIGAIHRMAAAIDGRWRLTAGALSSTPERSRESAKTLGLPPERSYGTWREMLDAESRLPQGARVDAVAIVTPNAAHFEPALAFIEAGFNIICDKPMVTTSADAAQLADAVEKSRVVFAVMYNYTGYPMVRQAAAMVRSGELGDIRKVFVEHHQGWLATDVEAAGQKQAAWRVDPGQAGLGGAIGDIGTHAENLLSTVTGLTLESVCADLTAFVPGRTLDDDASVLLRFTGGAKGVLTASQVCIGERNALTLRIHGSSGSLAWRQEEPETLVHDSIDGARRILARGVGSLGPSAAAATRLPGGHPEGFIEAFANIYRGVADAIEAGRMGHAPTGLAAEFPTAHDGARGVRFVEAVVQSASSGGIWASL